ncbi:MAG: transketolase family protein [Candidatus Aureabacteria bacterium]|nr:transketolase family protein [Candidatus Auribacterota bacterium]
MTELKATRDAYGEALVEIGKNNNDVVVLDADLSASTKTAKFREHFPDRFFNVGVAEQNLINIAAGLSTCGKTVFASSFALFVTGRPWEQIRNTVAYSNLNVKIVASHGGISVGADGSSHQSLEDIAIMRVIPNMRVIVPCDANESRNAVLAAAATPGPFYIRLGREKVPMITGSGNKFKVGKAEVLRDGKDVTVIACGIMVDAALRAADILKKDGVEASVIDMHTIKPIDTETIMKYAGKTGCVVTAEEHSIIGGLGAAVCEFLSENHPVPVYRIGTRDCFGQSGEPASLLKKYNMTPENICEGVKKAIKMKK